MEVENVRECVKTIYSNRVAFANIAIGYAASIIGDKENISNVVLIAFIAIGTVTIECKSINALAKHWYKEDIKVTYSELPNYVDGTASKEDIDELIKRTLR